MSVVIHSETTAPKKRSCWRILFWVTGFAVVVGVAGYVYRTPLLCKLADVWIVNEPVSKADAIVILGGGLENRPFAAAKLFQNGIAPRILYMDVQPGLVEELGLSLPEAEQTRRILLSNNVPEAALTVIGKQVASTYDESCAVRDWAKTSGVKTILVPTDLFHTRRVRWLFQKQLAGTSVRVQVVAVNPIRYSATNWWQHEEGLIAFQNEILKRLYYQLKY